MSFKVFDLACAQGHRFEGWFRSHEDYDAQHARGLVQCPVCQSTQVERCLSAPNVHVSSRTAPASAPVADKQQEEARRELFRRMREHLRQVENVGDDFAGEARRIHAGESPERPIRGTATQEERRELADEGITAVAVPFPLDDDALH